MILRVLFDGMTAMAPMPAMSSRKALAVVGFVSKDGFGGLAFEQDRRGCDVPGLTGGDDDTQRSAEAVCEHVDFGRQSASGAPQRLILRPPFPVAACWWARTMVESSIRYWLSRSAASMANTRSHTPAWHQRLKRLCTVFQCP